VVVVVRRSTAGLAVLVVAVVGVLRLERVGRERLVRVSLVGMVVVEQPAAVVVVVLRRLAQTIQVAFPLRVVMAWRHLSPELQPLMLAAAVVDRRLVLVLVRRVLAVAVWVVAAVRRLGLMARTDWVVAVVVVATMPVVAETAVTVW
jgi:hypothetical protein